MSENTQRPVWDIINENFKKDMEAHGDRTLMEALEKVSSKQQTDWIRGIGFGDQQIMAGNAVLHTEERAEMLETERKAKTALELSELLVGKNTSSQVQEDLAVSLMGVETPLLQAIVERIKPSLGRLPSTFDMDRVIKVSKINSFPQKLGSTALDTSGFEDSDLTALWSTAPDVSHVFKPRRSGKGYQIHLSGLKWDELPRDENGEPTLPSEWLNPEGVETSRKLRVESVFGLPLDQKPCSSWEGRDIVHPRSCDDKIKDMTNMSMGCLVSVPTPTFITGEFHTYVADVRVYVSTSDDGFYVEKGEKIKFDGHTLKHQDQKYEVARLRSAITHGWFKPLTETAEVEHLRGQNQDMVMIDEAPNLPPRLGKTIHADHMLAEEFLKEQSKTFELVSNPQIKAPEGKRWGKKDGELVLTTEGNSRFQVVEKHEGSKYQLIRQVSTGETRWVAMKAIFQYDYAEAFFDADPSFQP